MKFKKSFLLFTLVMGFLLGTKSFAINGFMGEDNRIEVKELTDILKTRSQSIVTVVRRHENNHVAGGGFKFNIENANPLDLKICEDQRFSSQARPSEVVCGGILISGDLILTAQNCIQEGSDCTSDYSFIFGYTEGQSEFNPRDVYHCQEVIWQKNSNGVKAAIVRLDRPVNARIPVPLNLETPILENQNVVLIGPHAKLPLKSSTGQVRYVASEPALSSAAVGTDLDCHINDHGSAVLNPEGQLLGVLSATHELGVNVALKEALPPNTEPVTIMESPTESATSPQTALATTLPLSEPSSELEGEQTVDPASKDPSLEPTKELANLEPPLTTDGDSSSGLDKTVIISDASRIETQAGDTLNVGSANIVNPDPNLNVEATKSCVTWTSPTDVIDRSLYQPVNDSKMINSTFIPRGCTFTPISSFIDEVSTFLPQYKRIIRTPTASQ